MSRTTTCSFIPQPPRACLPALLASLAALAPLSLGAQQAAPQPLRACYVPGSGTVYRIQAPGAPAACAGREHVEFDWPAASSAGLAGTRTASAAAASGDPYRQYLLAEGVRNVVNGFAVTNTSLDGTIPATGTGKRLMWYAKAAALRSGVALGDEWDHANVGTASFASGVNVKASGFATAAFGNHTVASGYAAVAAGVSTTASGKGAVAAGEQANATGAHSAAIGYYPQALAEKAIALGNNAIANGPLSTALGNYASTNGRRGAFVIGDASGTGAVRAQQDNQFVARAQRFWLGNNNAVTATAGRFLETHTGAYLSSGGVWTNTSDSAAKTAYQSVEGEQVLAKLAELPIYTWSYKVEADSVRHLGPTAQAFRRAFGLGDSEKAIATVDADGVSLAAVQALERRTRALQRENAELRTAFAAVQRDNAALAAQVQAIAQLEARLARIERGAAEPAPTAVARRRQ